MSAVVALKEIPTLHLLALSDFHIPFIAISEGLFILGTVSHCMTMLVLNFLAMKYAPGTLKGR